MAVQKHEMVSESIAPVEKGAVRRRGLIAGAAALAAGVLATRMGNEAVDAAENTAILQGAANDAANTAATRTTVTAPTTVTVFRALQTGVATPDTTTDALQGIATNPAAPPGTVNNSGVHGRNDALGGIGTTGVATNGTGVYGQSNSGSGVGAVSTSGAGVFGQSTSGTGVVGLTSTGLYGVAGTAGTASGSAGLLGYSGNPAGVAFGSVVAGGATTAGFFNGDVYVTGRLVVHGVDSKSALLDHPDGSNRLVYCVEATESWIEDFGTGTVAAGKAEIALDKDFAALMRPGDYHVFITEHDAGNKGLSVTARNQGSFSVQEKQGGTSSGTFSFRVVARPNSGRKPERLAAFKVPHLAMPDANIFKAPTLPKHKP